MTTGQKVVYIRVSSEDQETARQEELTIGADKVFLEKVSGKNRERKQLREMIAYVREGDKIHVWSLDRLARNMRDLLNIVEEVTSKGVDISFEKNNMSFGPNSTATPEQILMFQILASFAEFERTLIRQRQAEGIAIAKAAGKYAGRKKALNTKQIEEVRRLKEDGVAISKIAAKFKVSRHTIYTYLKDDQRAVA